MMRRNPIPLTPMGFLTPGSSHVGPSAQPPIAMSGNFLPHMSAESPSNISPNFLELVSQVSETFGLRFHL